jgi:hypothetical protein
MTGDFEGYGRICREMLQRFGNTEQPQTAECTTKACLLLPGALSDAAFDRVQKLAERAVTGTEKERYYRFFALAKGLADYRAGRDAQANEWIERFGPTAHGQHWDATGFALLAMASHRLGRAEEAKAALAEARAILSEKMPDPTKGQRYDAGFWHDWVHAQLFCREAGTLLHVNDTTPTN